MSDPNTTTPGENTGNGVNETPDARASFEGGAQQTNTWSAQGTSYPSISGNVSVQTTHAQPQTPGQMGGAQMAGGTSYPQVGVPFAAPSRAPGQAGQAGGLGQSGQPGQTGQPMASNPFGPPAGMPATGSAYTGGAPGTKAARRGPGWFSLIAVSALMALLASGGTYAVLSLDNQRLAAESNTSKLFDNSDSDSASGAVAEPVTNSTSAQPDWEAVASAVRSTVVAIQVVTQNAGDQGSGVILDHDGRILTNNHVVASAAQGGKITVVLSDGRVFAASIVGLDAMTDLAVIKIDTPPSDLTVATLGESANLKVGQAVAAIGNPLGLSSTVTTGIISALDRPVTVQQSDAQTQEVDPNDPFGSFGRQQQGSTGGTLTTTNAIQVDASINPGNSGGPLFDAKGRVIGINSSIASLSRGSSGQAGSIGLGFAIPVDLAQMVAKQLISNGVAEHAFLGVGVGDGTATVDGVTRLGAKVRTVSQGTAAEEAGVKAGDVIVAIDGNEVGSGEALTGWVRRYPSGSQVRLTIVRDGKELQLNASLRTRSDAQLQ
ncbi:MAG: trypsin-like peptidase domain-containing protein [Actinomycetaceae bacterium]|nr:trypsin-like peptidase domain-containing protein [Actinomycetaceae bacterium]